MLDKPKRIRGYNAVVCIGHNEFAKYRQINNIERFFEFVGERFGDWRFVWVYRRLDNKRIIIKRGEENNVIKLLVINKML